MRLRLVRTIGRVVGALAVLALVTSATADARQVARNPGGVRTVATTSAPIIDLMADGVRLAWVTDRFDSLKVLNLVSHRLVSLGRHPCGTDGYWGWTWTVFAGTRALFGCGSGSLSWEWEGLNSASLEARGVPYGPGAAFVVAKDDIDYYGNTMRAAGDGRTLVYFGSGFPNDDPPPNSWREGTWRIVGSRTVRIPYKPQPVADIAVSGRRFATLDRERACACDWLPVYSPDGREIAWNHGGAIWSMQPDGTHRLQLSHAPVADPRTAPRWSPTGATLAFEAKGSIFLIDRDGTNQRQLVAGGRPSWSPDGSRLAFVRANDLWLVGADGKGETRLTNDALKTTSRPDWSPDGTKLAVARVGGIHVIDASSGAARYVSATTALYEDHDPVWSPDGSRIAFERRESQYRESAIFVVGADGANARSLTTWPSLDYVEAPSWSPDGTRIAFVFEGVEDDRYSIRTIRTDGTKSQAHKWSGRPGAPSWSPDGATVVYADGGYPSHELGGVWRTRVGATDEPTRLDPTTTPLEVRDLISGRLIRRWDVPVESTDLAVIAFSGRYVLARVQSGEQAALDRYDIVSGKRFPRLPLRFASSVSGISLASDRGVYRADRRIVYLDLKTGRRETLATVSAKQASSVAGPVIEGKRVFWTERFGNESRVREVALR